MCTMSLHCHILATSVTLPHPPPHPLTPLQGLANNNVRREIWRYLLNYYPFNVTEIERMEIRRNKEKEYWAMKQQWQSFTAEQENRFTKWREAKVLISEFRFLVTLSSPRLPTPELSSPLHLHFSLPHPLQCLFRL